MSNPDGRWVAQQARNLLMRLADRGQRFRLLLHDRDSKFTGGFDEVLRSEGKRIVRKPIRAPNANAYAERWVGTLRRAIASSRLISAPIARWFAYLVAVHVAESIGQLHVRQMDLRKSDVGHGDLLRLLVSGVRRRLPAVSGRPAIERPWVAAIARTMTAWPNG